MCFQAVLSATIPRPKMHRSGKYPDVSAQQWVCSPHRVSSSQTTRVKVRLLIDFGLSVASEH